MWLVKELWFHRKQHYLNIIANSVALFLVLIVNILSNTVLKSVDEQLASFGVDVNMIQIINPSTVKHEWFDEWVKESAIEEASVFYSGSYEDYSIVSCECSLSSLFSFQYTEGSFFSKCDQLYNNNVAVLGYNAYKHFKKPAINSAVSIDGVSFQVVGILKQTEGNLFIDIDNSIFVPEGYHLRNSNRQLSYYYKGTDELISSYINESNYLSLSQGQLAQAAAAIMSTLRNILLCLAYVAVFVSFVGLVNNTLASLKSRTFEIGVKKAFGASNKAIYLQFMLETMIVLTCSLLISALLAMLSVSLIVPPSLAIDYGNSLRIIVRIMVLGMLCGILPAYRASKVTVIEAIRSSG